MQAEKNSQYQDQNSLRKTIGNISPVKGILFQMNEHSPKIKNQIPLNKPHLSGAFRSGPHDHETSTKDQPAQDLIRTLCKMKITLAPLMAPLIGFLPQMPDQQICDLLIEKMNILNELFG